jgi:MFS family permease
LGFVFGAILSGLFTQLFNWRAAFFLLAIVYFCISVVAVFTVPKDTTTKQTLDSGTIKKLDLPGTAMTILGIGMFCAALRYVNWVGLVLRQLMTCSLGSDAPQGWKTPYVLVLLIVGVLLIAAFIIWEIKNPYAMIPMSIFKDRDFSLVRWRPLFALLNR